MTTATNNRKIEIYVAGQYVATTTWSRTCKGAIDAYRAAHPDTPRRMITAEFKPSK